VECGKISTASREQRQKAEQVEDFGLSVETEEAFRFDPEEVQREDKPVSEGRIQDPSFSHRRGEVLAAFLRMHIFPFRL